MATFGDVINRVIANLADARAGEDRATILAELKELMENDIPQRVGGRLLQGYVDLTVGGTGAPADGRYTLPSAVRSVDALSKVSNGKLIKQWSQPSKFFEAFSPATTGEPTDALVWGTNLWLRPIPGTTTSYTIRIFGSLWPDYSSATESTVVTPDEVVPALIAGGTMMAALRYKTPDAAQLWAQIFERRLGALASGAKRGVSTAVRGVLY